MKQPTKVVAIVDAASEGVITIDDQGIVESSHPSAACVLGGCPHQATTPPPDGVSQAEFFDVDSILENFGGDAEFVAECIDILKKDYPPLLVTMREATVNQDVTQLNRAAHSLKGAISTFTSGAPFIAAQRLENIGSQDDLTNATEIVTDLETGIANLLDELASSFRISGDQPTTHSVA